jgi:hypothetical protein
MDEGYVKNPTPQEVVSGIFTPKMKTFATHKIYNYCKPKVKSQEDVVSVVEYIERLKKLDDVLI